MVIPQTIVALAPILAPSSTYVLRNSRRTFARGRKSLVNAAFGPTKTRSPSVTPIQIDMPFLITESSPIVTPSSTKE